MQSSIVAILHENVTFGCCMKKLNFLEDKSGLQLAHGPDTTLSH